MSDEEKTKLRLEIAHVLFVDIVGYSKLLLNQQSKLLHELNEIVSGTKEGKLIRLPTGDGMGAGFPQQSRGAVDPTPDVGGAIQLNSYGRSPTNAKVVPI